MEKLPPYFKTNYNAPLMKKCGSGKRIDIIDQWNLKENPGLDPLKNAQLVFDKAA